MLTYEAVFDLMPFSIYVTDTKTCELVFVNKTFERVRGRHDGKKCWESVYGRSSKCIFCKIDNLVDDDGKPNGHSISFDNFDEYVDMWYQIQEAATFWPDGRVVKYSILIDISTTKEAQNRLAEAHAALSIAHDDLLATHAELNTTQHQLERTRHVAELARVVATLAHRLNTPTGNVLTAGSVVSDAVVQFRRRMEDGRLRRAELIDFLDTVGQCMEIVIESARRSARLIETYKSLATDVGGGLQPVGLDGVFVSLESALRHLMPEGVVLTVEDAAGLFVLGHQNLLISILMEIVGNAARHAFPGGRSGRIRVSAETVGADEVALVVKDDGIGILPEHTERIFQPFYTDGRIGGESGLGLAIVHNVVIGPLGGRIHIDGCEGRGTMLTVTLPRAGHAEADV